MSVGQEECLSGGKSQKIPEGAKNQNEENEETWISSVTWAGHNSGDVSPPLKQAA